MRRNIDHIFMVGPHDNDMLLVARSPLRPQVCDRREIAGIERGTLKRRNTQVIQRAFDQPPVVGRDAALPEERGVERRPKKSANASDQPAEIIRRKVVG